MMTVVSKNVALLILVHSFKTKKNCQINSAFNLLRFVHNFTRYCVFFTGKQLFVIFYEYLNKKNWCWLVTFQHMSRFLTIAPYIVDWHSWLLLISMYAILQHFWSHTLYHVWVLSSVLKFVITDSFCSVFLSYF